MKKLGISLMASLLLVSNLLAQKSIVVTNNTDFERKAEIVEVNTKHKKNSILTNDFILKNQKGIEVPYQLVYNKNKEITGLLFQADVNAKSSSVYSITEGKPAPVKAKTFGRFVPERKDDFAWENDFAGYRMFGPALAKENPSSGVDFWAKKTSELVVDQRYKDELENGLSYHIDRGNGLDFYKVGHALGCGGIAPYVADSLWVGNHFDSYEVFENGPLRTVFSLTYNKVKVGNDYYKQTIKITTTAGSLLNKAVVTYSGRDQKMKLASGIYLHDGQGNIKMDFKTDCFITCKSNGYIAYAENATSEFKKPSGRNYVAVVVDNKGDLTDKKTAGHLVLLTDYKVGKDFTYYFGGGWNSWKFPTDKDWFMAVNDFTKGIKTPLKVKLK